MAVEIVVASDVPVFAAGIVAAAVAEAVLAIVVAAAAGVVVVVDVWVAAIPAAAALAICLLHGAVVSLRFYCHSCQQFVSYLLSER